MKKIIRVTNWDTSVLTADNVANKTHWFIKSSDECLTMMGLTATFTFTNTQNVTLAVNGYENNINIGMVDNSYSKFYSNASSFIWYVNTEKMELVGCACELNDNVASQALLSAHHWRSVVSTGKNSSTRYYGPTIAIKFKNSQMLAGIRIEPEFQTNAYESSGKRYFSSQIGVPLPDNKISITPTAGVKYNSKYCKMPILLGRDTLSFNGDYFEDVYVTEKYFTTPMKTSDNTKYIYDGKLFIVDDATDIGTIETTV